MKENRRNGIFYVSFPQMEERGIIAVVAGRQGGVSRDPFESLNMSFSSGDDPAAVLENRRRLMALFSLPLERMVACHQVHGTNVVKVTGKEAGLGAGSQKTAIPDCDGLATNVPGVTLSMNFADCTPLLFYDPRHHAIALSHGGWRGAAGNIGGKTVAKMNEWYGTRAGDIFAAVGPAIGPCCFEVGDDVIDAFSVHFDGKTMARLAKPKAEKGKYLFDLPEANRLLLMQAGIREDHIDLSRLCTYCHKELFYSYRRDGKKAGRHMAIMAIPDNR